MSIDERMLVHTSDRTDTAYYICPRCKISFEREMMHYCDRCGQRLDWSNYESARTIFAGTSFDYDYDYEDDDDDELDDDPD